jgi:hypothetical protein
MPRRRAKRPPPQDPPTRSGPALVVAGTIRSPGERESLEVVLSMRDGHVSLHSEKLELGSWPESGVEITPIDATSFAFTAEGDRMIFRPDDVISFSEELGARTMAMPAPAPAPRDTAPSRTRGRRSTKGTDAAARDAGPDARVPADARPETAAATTPTKSPTTVPPATPKGRRSVPKVSSSKAGRSARSRSGEQRPGLWLRSLDTVRAHGWFSLDRVPVYEDQRGQDHDHTWNHRAVATSGLSRHVCTICGKVKLR